MLHIIEKTREQVALTEEDIQELVEGIVNQSWPDYQLAAWLMAVVCRGLTDQETFWLTGAMAFTGHDHIQPLGLVDKHSTGGVGDKTTLVLAPLMASLGLPMAKMSGRGLGHTGGTLDKLESIAGFKTELSIQRIRRQVEEIGVAVVAQSPELAPADGRLYALRDVTGTVNNLSLIASSIMSKKLAAGTPNIVLDVKVGNGAFMNNIDQARRLAKLMVSIGHYHQRRVAALITAMQQPLGWAIGNAIEVNEAVACLKNSGPQDLREEVIQLASELVQLVKKVPLQEAENLVKRALADGRALHKFGQWVDRQGGSPAILTTPLALAPVRREWAAPATLRIKSINARAIGEAALNLGAGRHRLQDQVDPTVGILCYAKIGQEFHRSDLLAVVYANNATSADTALASLQKAIKLGEPDETLPLVLDRMGNTEDE